MPRALDNKPRILEYIGTDRNSQTMKRTAKTSPRTTCHFCFLFMLIFRFIDVKLVIFRQVSKITF